MSARRVIVGVDRLDQWVAAVDWAANEAATTGKVLVIVHASTGAVTAAASPRGGPIPGGNRELTAAVARAGLSLGPDRIQPVLRSGSASRTLVELAYAEDVLVLGAAPPARWRHPRSTIDQVLAGAPCPVVIVAAPAAIVDRTKALNGLADNGFAGQVVVGVDDSAPARAALSFGFAYAVRHRLGLVALNVAGRMTPVAAVAFLAGQVGQLPHEDPRIPLRRLVRTGPVGPTLVAAGLGAELLVIGGSAAGRGRSVGRQVIGSSVCPVAVVRPQ